MFGTFFAGVLMLVFARWCCKIVYINPLYWIPPMLALTIWAVLASRFYASVYEDLTMLVVFGIIGMICKYGKFSRPALLMSYILFPRIEGSYLQLSNVFFYDDIVAVSTALGGDFSLLSANYIFNNPTFIQHPVLPIAIIIGICLLLYGFFNKNRTMDYA